ncbi:Elongator subunit ELP6 NDAI_0I02620 [Naumovozyma dairenensis CBS 421]|uniref:Elongator complex protein 6 n=1 Tax=Naumovozyma dairenensis (strain ATCC 10597 / BCRC 20456 / CBS 421 / NBRC 0211 / NRRL Y-12639) TaxID=1071378 RepID=G0WGB9_NAUDC|nr:hypothetical protein NDAI_0I02620 [Naumovozyma dairenensis CBS 421]CCD26830.1 hypothetical protein NDAI_0I02620 [Naumovozyma dairenensis CBS 421]
MSAVQKQDLTIFSDQSIIPKNLCSNESHNVMLLTSTAATQPLWLINTLVESSIYGHSYSLNSSASSTNTINHNKPINPTSSLTIASFAHNKSFYKSSFDRLKINSNSYKILDFLTDFTMNETLGKPKAKIFENLLKLFPNDTTSTIILEQPEILFSLMGDHLSANELIESFLKPLIKKCGLLIIVTSVELYKLDYSMTKDVTELIRFISFCFHVSLTVLSLQPLQTGRAKDITGSLKITRGGATLDHLSGKIHVIENEYLYLNEKDSTKLFY